MGFFPSLERQSVAELMEDFSQADSAQNGVADEDRDLFLQEMGRKIAESGDTGLSFLLQESTHAEEKKLRAVILAFTFAPEPALRKHGLQVKEICVSHLRHNAPLVVAEAIDCLRLLRCKEAQPEVVSLLSHDAPFVVGAVLRFLSTHDAENAIPMLIEKLASPDPLLRQNAVDELEDLNYVQALPKIRPLLNDPDPDVRQAAETAVANLQELA